MAQAGKHCPRTAQAETDRDSGQSSRGGEPTACIPGLLQVKLRSSGYRLVYQVIDQEVVVFVVAVDKRERNQVYRKASERLRG